VQRLTREQAAVIGAFTGVPCGPFADIEAYARRMFARPVFVEEFAQRRFVDTLQDLATDDFLDLFAHDTEVGTMGSATMVQLLDELPGDVRASYDLEVKGTPAEHDIETIATIARALARCERQLRGLRIEAQEDLMRLLDGVKA
jgi:hypothetical protein